MSSNRADTADRVRELERSMRTAIGARIERARILSRPFSAEEMEYRFRAILQPRLVRFDDAKEELCRALRDLVSAARQRVALCAGVLEASNPLEVLARGFSVVVNDTDGSVVRDAAAVAVGARLTIRPLKGRIAARAETVMSQEDVSQEDA